jgi:biotin synthase-like enzyme
VQRCSLLSIKTSGCSEDCAYCAQSAHYSTVSSAKNCCHSKMFWPRPGARSHKAPAGFAWARPGAACAKLLTAKNPAADVDVALLRELGLHVESMTNDECLMTKE